MQVEVIARGDVMPMSMSMPVQTRTFYYFYDTCNTLLGGKYRSRLTITQIIMIYVHSIILGLYTA